MRSSETANALSRTMTLGVSIFGSRSAVSQAWTVSALIVAWKSTAVSKRAPTRAPITLVRVLAPSRGYRSSDALGARNHEGVAYSGRTRFRHRRR